ncbi:MAG: ATP-binding protein [Succinivibrionaceae bacterium]|nr:ATP-binding protein [Succinivibrionaceae bacterium]
MRYIDRAISETLGRRAGNSKCLLLTGARQVGKSTLLKRQFPQYGQVSLDNPMERLGAREDPQLFFMNHPCPVIVDEVQKEPALLEAIKERVDASGARGQFVLSGSQRLGLMKGISESLAGRVSILELPGLSLREIHGVGFNEHFVPNDEYVRAREGELCPYGSLWRLIHKGSFPELYDIDREWQDFYSSYVDTYLGRDINEFINADSVTFFKFMTVIAARTGQILNYAHIATEVGVSEPTVKNWISILERTGIVYLLEPYSSSALSRVIKSPKIYFRDTGLACYLTRWISAEALMGSAVAGNMFETFVVSEILKSYANAGMDYRFSIFYYRGKDKQAGGEREIDLIIEENGVLYPVEIKLTGSPRAAMGEANQVLDRIPGKRRGCGVILCLVDRKTYLRDNLLALPITYL